MVDEEKGFLFVRIPKTAGTTLTAVLAGAEFGNHNQGSWRIVCKKYIKGEQRPQRGEVEKEMKNHSKYIYLLFGENRKGVGAMHDDYVQWVNRFPGAKDYFSFSFVRNPWTWTISLYSFFKRICEQKRRANFGGRPSSKVKNREGLEHFKETIGLFGVKFEEYIKNPTILKFDRFVDVYFSDDSLHKSQSSFLKDENGEINMDYIGKFENLQSDWDFVSKKIGLAGRGLKNTNKSFSAEGNMTKYLESSEIKAKIIEGLAEDFENFNYSTNVIPK